jgi:uncharacterized protein YcbK (DUF882 family)
MSKEYISRHLLLAEYQCHHCGKLPPFLDPEMPSILHEILFDRYDRVWEAWVEQMGNVLTVSSGYRCPIWNQHEGGEALSLHIFGVALDLDVSTADEVRQLVQVAEAIDPDLRLGFEQYLRQGKTLVHMDIGYLVNPRFSLDLHERARW